MSKVIIRKAGYDYTALKPVIYELMDALIGSSIQEHTRVVIKPNLLAPAPPDKAIVTHPFIIKAVAEYVLEKGGKPQISDSPAVGSYEKILKDSGIKDALDGLDVEFREFRNSVPVDVGAPFNKIDIAEDAVNKNILINIPKLKTHTQMLLTLGIKNLFGCITGFKKPEWHLRTGVDREMFARLLVKIYKAVNPSVTILDGVLAMEGQGPVTNKIALEQALVNKDIAVDGDLPYIEGFHFPDITPLVFGPDRFHKFMRKHLVQRPGCDDSVCKLCSECWIYCPAKAISHDNKKIHFDYDKCIRCYCCIEVCPHGALSTYETIMGKVVRNLLKI
jgi:uncharacterized protein (DUF362 family)/Pyruvate/2-oxoacid:ferredoxin oxidoreductase delta subunit